MIKFLSLTTSMGNKVLINISQILVIKDGSGCQIGLNNDHIICVQEPYESVAWAIKNLCNSPKETVIVP
jgi:hypothetical protein